jgi:acetyl esterase
MYASGDVRLDLALDPGVFDHAAVPDVTRRAIERLRREGDKGRGGVLREEPPSELAGERVIPGPGGALRLRVLAADDARACYLHVHGGGWTLGGADRQDATLMRVAMAARVAVVAVDYRLAPAHPHPAAVEDCVAAIAWLAENGDREFGTARLIVGGESVGAHLAALALLALRDRGPLPAVTAANLAYGVYDVSMTPSARLWGDQRVVISTPDLALFAEQYAPAARHRDPDVSPLYADLTGMPPALFSCGTLDPLLDDTLFMAIRWQEAGNDAQLALYPGAPHEFLNLREEIPAEHEARERMIGFIDR